jgi:hypothetical protein
MLRRSFIVVFVFFLVCLLSCRGPEGPVGPPGHDAAASLTDPSIQPKIIFTSPAANSQGPYLDFTFQMTVRFNKIMNPSSVKRAMRISSPGGNIILDTTSVRTTGGDVFTFTAYDIDGRSYLTQWRVGRVYTLDISDSATDINGNHLTPSFAMTFSPEPFFRVRTITPTNGATDVELGSIIGLQFNAPVDSGIATSIHINPASEGYWRFSYYSDSSLFSYVFTSLTELDTLYTITIDSIAHDREGNHLSAQFFSSFRTVPFRITYTYPGDGWTGMDRRLSIELYTNAPCDSSTVRSAFSMTPTISGLAVFEYDYSFIVAITDSLQPLTKYTVEFSTALRSSSGKHLKAPYTFSFTTGY